MNFKRVLILSPHTDDAELGCGGFIQKLIENNSQILWVAFSTAKESVPKGLPKDVLKQEFTNVVNFLNLSSDQYIIYEHTVRRLNLVRQEILEDLVKIRNEFKPDLVVGPSLNDYHQDHQVIANEMVRAFKSSSSIICYELPWNHLKFENQLFVRLEKKHIEKKLEILGLYKSQVTAQRHYFSRDFIFGLASTRGVQIGSKYAEAFEVIRWIA